MSNETTDVPEAADAVFQTTEGDIYISIMEDTDTGQNFIQYIEEGFYDGTIFHRVIPGFVIQGGGFIPNGTQKETRDPISLEDTDAKNLRGTLSMARTRDPDSATSQFFVNLQDNAALDPNPTSAGYTVFGEVVQGMDVVDSIASVETGSNGPHQDWPKEDVVIEEARLLE